MLGYDLIESYFFASTVATETISQLTYDSIVAKAAHSAEQSVRDDFGMYWSIVGGAMTLVLALVSFLGFSQIKDIKQNIKSGIVDELRTDIVNSPDFRQDIRESIARSIIGDTLSQIKSIEQQMSFYRAQWLSEQVKKGTSFTNSERDSLLSALVTAKENPSITNSPDFLVVLENIVDSFAGAGLFNLLERIDSDFRSICISHAGICMTMLQSFGTRVLGEVDPDPEFDAEEAFVRYADACRDHKLLGLSIAYMTPYLQDKGDDLSARRIRNLLQDLDTSEDFHKHMFIQAVESSISQQNDIAFITRMKRKFEIFISSNKGWYERMKSEYGSLEH